MPFGIVVNKEVKRFYDEGEDFWPKRYAIWGKLIAEQPEQIAYSIIDSKALPHFMPSVFPPVEAASIAELAAAWELDPTRLRRSVNEFNRSVRAGRFDPGSLDECRTDRASIRRRATGRGRSIRRRTTAIRCGRGSRLLI